MWNWMTCVLVLSTGGLAAAAEPALQVGDKAPDFTLKSVDGETSTLSQLTAKGPVVLVFSRAHWCPYCMGHMQALNKQLDGFRDAQAQVVAVFRENREGNDGLAKVRKASKASFLLLDDPEKKQTTRYSPEGYDAYVIDRGGIIRAIIDGTKSGRPDPEKLLAAVRELNAQ